MDACKKLIVFRHDVDISLENALKFARLEKSLGIQSTYFIRVSAKYNIMFYPNITILREIVNLGHEIGLHYTLDIPKILKIDQTEFFIKEKRISHFPSFPTRGIWSTVSNRFLTQALIQSLSINPNEQLN